MSTDNTIFHVNPATNRPNICRAGKKPCPFQHFDSKEQAKAYIEENLGAQSNILTSSSSSKVDNATKLQSTIKEILQENKNPTLETLSTIGNLVNNEIMSKLSFNPHEIEKENLSTEQLKEIEHVHNEVMGSLVSCSQDTGVQTMGARSKDLNDVIKVLPDGAKKFAQESPIEAKTINAKSSLGGSYKNVNVATVKTLEEEPNVFSQESFDNAQDGEFFENTGGYALDIQHGDTQSFRIMKKGDNKQYYCGKKPKGSQGWKKVADKVDVVVGDKKMEFSQPVYLMTTIGDKERRQVIEIPPAKDDNSTSTILHEYSHAIQHGHYRENMKSGEQDLDSEMYHKLQGERFFSEKYNMESFRGFPDEYMGTGYREFFPVATEGFFKPTAKNLFYGKNRHDRSDDIKKWTIGFWLHLNNKGANR